MFWFSLPFLCALCALCGENLLTYCFQTVKNIVSVALDFTDKGLTRRDGKYKYKGQCQPHQYKS